MDRKAIILQATHLGSGRYEIDGDSMSRPLFETCREVLKRSATHLEIQGIGSGPALFLIDAWGRWRVRHEVPFEVLTVEHR